MRVNTVFGGLALRLGTASGRGGRVFLGLLFFLHLFDLRTDLGKVLLDLSFLLKVLRTELRRDERKRENKATCLPASEDGSSYDVEDCG